MPRPVMIGIVGDSASGKTTLTRGIVRVLGEDQVTHVAADHYHRFDRAQRAERGLTPLDPRANHLDILTQHLAHLRAGDAIMKPVYDHRDGTFAAAEYVRPKRFTIVEGLLGFHNQAMRDTYDLRIFLDPPEDLRRAWKVQRDCSRRGYTTDQVLEEIDRREGDAEEFIRPQRSRADLVISFMPTPGGDVEHLDARVTMRPGLEHPDLETVMQAADGAADLSSHGEDLVLHLSGRITPEASAEVEAAIWARMPFAEHLRTERLGEFTVATDLRRSETLGITQLLVLYQVISARAALAIGATV